MIRLIRQWQVSRTLDSGGAGPARDRLTLVHEALRTTHPAMREPSPGLHDRTLDAVRRASRQRSPSRPFLSLHLVMAGLLLVCGVIGLYAMLAPQPGHPQNGSQANAADPHPSPVPGGSGEGGAPSSPFGGLKIAGLWQEIAAPLWRATEESMQAPAKQEAQHMVADAKRLGEFVLVKIPFASSGDSKEQ